MNWMRLNCTFTYFSLCVSHRNGLRFIVIYSKLNIYLFSIQTILSTRYIQTPICCVYRKRKWIKISIESFCECVCEWNRNRNNNNKKINRWLYVRQQGQRAIITVTITIHNSNISYKHVRFDFKILICGITSEDNNQ